ncbi:MAG: iron-containing redox enzyme family protein [Magnetospirillum sp.]|nr:iron-containing redox enzyme family protein [Magnetospirillum sp.]
MLNDDGTLPPQIHPLPRLLELSVDQVLDSFIVSQRDDFTRVVAAVAMPGSSLHEVFAQFGGEPAEAAARLQHLFLDLHRHVMEHPVWRHPFFRRVFEGRVDAAQARRFSAQYFNQIKNTRQCVALAIGRFHGLAATAMGSEGERRSELTQVALAQLVADEYGVGSHGLDDYPELGRLLGAKTHMVMYRQLFEGLGMSAAEQDVPMLPEVADNVLIQRLVAGHEAFTPLEALASVGLGMEWGVPEFFSLLLGGLIRVSERDRLGLTPHHLEVFIAHVRYDVLHAISVMLVTSLHMSEPDHLQVVKNACNMLMTGRYAMMSGLYRHVFGEDCPGPAAIGLEPRHRVTDARLFQALRDARAKIAPAQVIGGEAYARQADLPFEI